MYYIYNRGLTQAQITGVSQWHQKTVAARLVQVANTVKPRGGVPKEMSNGMELYISSRNSKSYVKGNLLVRDLSGNGRDFRLNKVLNLTPQHEWISDGGHQMMGPPASIFNINPESSLTIIYRAKTTELGQNVAFKFHGFNAHHRGLFVHPSWTNGRLYYDQGGAMSKKQVDDKKSCQFGDTVVLE